MVAAFANDGNGSMTRDRGHAVPAVSAATSLSAARGGVSSEVRLCGVCAYVACMYMHRTAS